MHAMTIMRAIAFIGMAITFWSLNLRWGLSEDMGNGPPKPWERFVVLAGLLSFIATALIAVSGKKGNPPTPKIRLTALLFSTLAAGVPFYLYFKSLDMYTTALHGNGWLWLLIGTALVLGSCSATFSIRPAETPAVSPKRTKKTKGSRKKRKKHR